MTGIFNAPGEAARAIYKYKDYLRLYAAKSMSGNTATFGYIITATNISTMGDVELIDFLEGSEAKNFKFFLELILERNISQLTYFIFANNKLSANDLLEHASINIALQFAIVESVDPRPLPDMSRSVHYSKQVIMPLGEDRYRILADFHTIYRLFHRTAKENDKQNPHILSACNDWAFMSNFTLYPEFPIDAWGVTILNPDEMYPPAEEKLSLNEGDPLYPSDVSYHIEELRNDSLEFTIALARINIGNLVTADLSKLDFTTSIYYAEEVSFLNRCAISGYAGHRIKKISPFDLVCETSLMYNESEAVFKLISQLYSSEAYVVLPSTIQSNCEYYETAMVDGKSQNFEYSNWTVRSRLFIFHYPSKYSANQIPHNMANGGYDVGLYKSSFMNEQGRVAEYFTSTDDIFIHRILPIEVCDEENCSSDDPATCEQYAIEQLNGRRVALRYILQVPANCVADMLEPNHASELYTRVIKDIVADYASTEGVDPILEMYEVCMYPTNLIHVFMVGVWDDKLDVDNDTEATEQLETSESAPKSKSNNRSIFKPVSRFKKPSPFSFLFDSQ